MVNFAKATLCEEKQRGHASKSDVPAVGVTIDAINPEILQSVGVRASKFRVSDRLADAKTLA
jgi:hypothetical protein